MGELLDKLGESSSTYARVLCVFDATGGSSNTNTGNSHLPERRALLELALGGAVWSLPSYTLKAVPSLIMTFKQLQMQALSHASDPDLQACMEHGISLLSDPGRH